eukprot:7314883-Pyramimonas_sp.AAC.1
MAVRPASTCERSEAPQGFLKMRHRRCPRTNGPARPPNGSQPPSAHDNFGHPQWRESSLASRSAAWARGLPCSAAAPRGREDNREGRWPS